VTIFVMKISHVVNHGWGQKLHEDGERSKKRRLGVYEGSSSHTISDTISSFLFFLRGHRFDVACFLQSIYELIWIGREAVHSMRYFIPNLR